MNESIAPPASVVARLAADEATARRLADCVPDLFGEVAISAFETAPDWALEIVFAAPPDEAVLRDFIAREAGPEAARALAFERVAAKDWVAAALAGLPPVPAGRFLIHGAHHRNRIGANRIGIEIEAALACGTGHHGTTRG
jgi:ribosomal protein L11 methyltransferase